MAAICTGSGVDEYEVRFSTRLCSVEIHATMLYVVTWMLIYTRTMPRMRNLPPIGLRLIRSNP